MDSFDQMMSALPVEMIAVASKSAFGALVAFGVNKLAAYSTKAADAKSNRTDSSSLDAKLREFNRMQMRLASKLSSITPAAALLEIAATRGNTLLDPVVALIRDTRAEVEELTSRLDASLSFDSESQIDAILQLLPPILANLDSLVPLLQLNLAASGLSASTSIPGSVSLSRSLRASQALSRAAEADDGTWARVSACEGTLYILFEGHERTPGSTPASKTRYNWSWQEKFHRCEISLWRLCAPDGTITFDLRLLENYNDGRLHNEPWTKPDFATDVGQPGQLVRYSLSELRKLHLATSSALLNLEEENGDPVLLLKLANGEGKETWIAVGEYDEIESGGESESEDSDEDEAAAKKNKKKAGKTKKQVLVKSSTPGATLSQLEHTLRLSELESIESIPHLDAPDEVISLYLSGMSSGATADAAPIHSTPSSTPLSSVGSGTGLRSPGTPVSMSRRQVRGESPLALRSKTLTRVTTNTERVKRMDSGKG